MNDASHNDDRLTTDANPIVTDAVTAGDHEGPLIENDRHEAEVAR